MPNRSQIDAPPIAPPAAPRAGNVALIQPSNSQPAGSACNGSGICADASNGDMQNDLVPIALATSDSVVPEVDRQSPTERGWLSMQRAPAVLVSFIVHTVLLLTLALLTVTPRVGVIDSHALESATGEGNDDDAVDQAVEILAPGDSMAAPADLAIEMPATSPSTGAQSEAVLDQSIGELQKLDPSAIKIPTAQSSLSSALSHATNDMSFATLAATGVEGRSAENRDRTAKARGGTLESELAVERALEWLAAHQLPGGGWSLIHDGGKCNGQCKHNGSGARYEPAATGLALLAFLGAGYTHKSGKHQRTVHDGVYYLLQIIEEANNTGSFLHQSERGMYNHGIATFALCEAYQLSGDQDLKQPAQLAVNFIFSAQNYSGGWGYLPKQPGDLTISGWQMMAIKSAHAAGLEVPSAVILRIDNFLNTKQVPSGIFYGYSTPEKDPTCSAIGVLLRLFRGWSHTDPRALELAQFLVKKGRSNGDVYYNYYATLLLFHLGGPCWDTWNPAIREHLVKTQNQSGHEAGSWYFEDQYAKEGGRLYTTAMCAMTLEVYYRFSPLYQQADRPFEL
jgi:Prenyltransferase and squalene oxidase repeat